MLGLPSQGWLGSPNIVKNFREIAKNHINVNFRDKISWSLSFFRDYFLTEAPVLTIHVVTPPTILTRGVGACKCEEKWIGTGNNAEPFQILVLHQRLSIHVDALRRRDTYGRLNLCDLFAVKER